VGFEPSPRGFVGVIFGCPFGVSCNFVIPFYLYIYIAIKKNMIKKYPFNNRSFSHEFIAFFLGKKSIVFHYQSKSGYMTGHRHRHGR